MPTTEISPYNTKTIISPNPPIKTMFLGVGLNFPEKIFLITKIRSFQRRLIAGRAIRPVCGLAGRIFWRKKPNRPIIPFSLKWLACYNNLHPVQKLKIALPAQNGHKKIAKIERA
jgi:hypothetical protein